MKKCPQCKSTYGDDTLSYCLQDGSSLSVAYDSEATLIIGADEPTVQRTNPNYNPEIPTKTRFVDQKPTAVSVRETSAFSYAAVALLALIAGGAVVAYLKIDTSAPANTLAQPKAEIPVISVSPFPEKQVVIRQPEATSSPKAVVSQPANVSPDSYNPVSEQNYRVIGVAYNDVLFIRPKPNQLKEYVGKIPPNATGVRVYGNKVKVGKNFWVNVAYDGLKGWVNSKYLARE